MLNQREFSAMVARKHAAHLGQRDMRLIHDHQEIFGEEIDQCVGRIACLAVAQPTRIVFHAGTMTNFDQHFEIEAGPGGQALRFQQLAVLAKPGQPFF